MATTAIARRTRRSGLWVGGAVVAGALLVGCGSGATSAGAGGTPGPSISASTAPSGDPAATGTPASTAPGVAPGDAASADWPTYDRTPARSGVSVSSPPAGKLSSSWTAHLDGDVYGQPLVLRGHVYVATENDTVYDLDGITGSVVWKHHLASPVTSGLPCGDVSPSGITGTPVIDVRTGRIYVVTFTADPGYRHTLWALATTDGHTIFDRTVDAPGSDPRAHQERGALAILGSRVYVPYGGLAGDCSDYKGRVVGAPSSGAGSLVSFVTPNQREAGIWAPPGPAVRDGTLYVATGNGTPVSAVDDSDSVLRLSPTLRQVDRFTPSNYQQLSADDLDLGSTSPAMVAGGRVLMIGKQGLAYLLDGTHLGGTGGQLATDQVCHGAFGGGAVDGDTVVIPCSTGLYAVETDAGRPARITPLWHATGFYSGSPIVAGGVVWDETKSGSLRGFELSSGKQVADLSTPSPVTSFPSLTAAGNRLFVPEGAEVASYTGA
ncbi:MAG TPA: PQQ-binding-like beta-propeller repeat protein [Acidimicrobiales bacterium]|nr:PQQ-binding-like beta-propeller repeat protein [Acidimicrobiales bacterium]